MAVARGKRASRDANSDAVTEQDHAAAIERLREFAENGLDDPALDGLDDIDHGALADASADLGAPALSTQEQWEQVRIVEALLFAAPQPLSEKKIADQLPPGVDVGFLIEQLVVTYADRGINLVKVGGRWSFRTAEDLSYLLEKYAVEQRRLSKAALETLAIIAFHQPVTRAEIEEIRGVQTSKGTLDVLMETNWIRPRGRRRAPGKPLTYGTTDEFLSHFGLESLGDLPGLAELKGAGLLDADLPPDFAVPSPKDLAALLPDELPLEEDGEETEELDLDVEADGHEPGSDAAVGDAAVSSVAFEAKAEPDEA